MLLPSSQHYNKSMILIHLAILISLNTIAMILISLIIINRKHFLNSIRHLILRIIISKCRCRVSHMCCHRGLRITTSLRIAILGLTITTTTIFLMSNMINQVIYSLLFYVIYIII